MDKVACPKCNNKDVNVVSESTYPGLYYCSNCQIDIRKCKKCKDGVLSLQWGPASNIPMTCNRCNNRTDKSGTSRGGCYIATCVYGSYESPQVLILRQFRDEFISTTILGRLFIRSYYLISPYVVKHVGHKKWFTYLSKTILDRLITILIRN